MTILALVIAAVALFLALCSALDYVETRRQGGATARQLGETFSAGYIAGKADGERKVHGRRSLPEGRDRDAG